MKEFVRTAKCDKVIQSTCYIMRRGDSYMLYRHDSTASGVTTLKPVGLFSTMEKAEAAKKELEFMGGKA